MKIFTTFCFLLIATVFYSQDPSFSQGSNNLTYLNPAFTGTSESFRGGLTYRNQWPGINANYTTTNLYVDQYLNKYGSIGFKYIRDVSANVEFNNNIYLDYSYGVNIGNAGVLKAGLEFGFLNARLDFDKMTFGSSINSSRGFIYPSNSGLNSHRKNVELGAGLLFYNKLFFLGYGLHHINRANMSFLVGGESRLPMLHSVYSGLNIKIGEFLIMPQFDFKLQNDFQNLTTLIKAKYKWATLGLGVRQKDSYIGYASVTVKKQLNIGYSYDFTYSKLSVATRGAHEISMRILLNTLKVKNERALTLF